ncbi:MAG: single-stranded DNA-binding protein [Treponema sp.]|jgi:single-strand DNA-binding protein|nr:single-stranded DNA-binding protein [Treponema sp.]
MNNLNSILIEGNLVKDPLYRTTPKGTPLCTFTLASNRFFKQDSGLEKEVGFFDVESWAKLAENCYNLGRKGRGVRVVGRLKQDRWNGSDGKHHSRIAIVAEHVEFKPDFKKNGKADNSETSEMADAALDSGEEMVPPEDIFEEVAIPEEFTSVPEMETVKF